MRFFILILMTFPTSAWAKPQCSNFETDRNVFPESVQELQISVFDASNYILEVKAITKIKKVIADGLFVCEMTDGKVLCMQDDDGGKFEISSNNDSVELKSRYFRLVKSDDSPMSFMTKEQRGKVDLDMESEPFVLKGKVVPCAGEK